MWPTILLLSSIHLFTIERGPRWLFYGSKPLPVLLMAALITLNPTVDANLAFWIFSGLILSAIGDVLLSLPKDKFISGLSSFLLAHICYVLGFIGMVNTISWWIPVMILALGILAFLLLLPNLGTMTLPVAIYILIIVAMAPPPQNTGSVTTAVPPVWHSPAPASLWCRIWCWLSIVSARRPSSRAMS